MQVPDEHEVWEDHYSTHPEQTWLLVGTVLQKTKSGHGSSFSYGGVS